jgi:hypothetical protein
MWQLNLWIRLAELLQRYMGLSRLLPMMLLMVLVCGWNVAEDSSHWPALAFS